MRVADADEMVLDTPFALDVGRNAQLGLPRKYVVGYSGYQASSLDSLMAAATQDLSVPVEWNDEVEFFRSLPDLVVGRECVVYKNVRPWQIQPVEWMLLGATVDEPLALFAAHLLHTIASSVALPPDVYGRGLNYAAYGELLGVPTPSAVGLRAHSQFPQPHLLGMPARIDECAIVSDATRTYVRAPVRVPTGAFAAELPLAVAKHWPNTILVDCEPDTALRFESISCGQDGTPLGAFRELADEILLSGEYIGRLFNPAAPDAPDPPGVFRVGRSFLSVRLPGEYPKPASFVRVALQTPLPLRLVTPPARSDGPEPQSSSPGK
jgi:hypothetical protein